MSADELTRRPRKLVRFGDYELELASGQLWRDGIEIPMAPKPRQLLVELVRRAGRPVRHAELRAALWPDAHVTETSLTRAVNDLRSALGEDARTSGGVVRTVRGFGYRLGVEVDVEPLLRADPLRSGDTRPSFLSALYQGALVRPTTRDRLRRAELLADFALRCHRANEPASADPALSEMLEIARRIEDPDAALDIRLAHLGIVEFRFPPRDPSERQHRIDALVDDARQRGRVHVELEACKHRIGLLLELGLRAEVETDVARFEQRVPSQTQGPHRSRWAAYRAMLAMLDDDAAEARRWIADAERTADPLDPGESRFTPVCQRTLLAASDAELESAEREIRPLVDAFPGWPSWRAALALVLMRRDRREDVANLFEDITSAGIAPVPPQMNHAVTLCVLAETASWLGDRRHAAEIRRWLEPLRGRNVVHGWGVACHGPVDYFLGLLARLDGDPAHARSDVERALDTAERTGSAAWIRRIRRALDAPDS